MSIVPKHVLPGQGRRITAARSTPFHLAAVLGARNDFLARVTAFLEIDTADQFKIRHLGHKLVLRCLHQQRTPGADLVQQPFLFRCLAPGKRKCSPGKDQIALLGHANGESVSHRRNRKRRARSHQPKRGELPRRFPAPQAVLPPLLACIRKFCLGSKNEHREAFRDRCSEVAREPRTNPSPCGRRASSPAAAPWPNTSQQSAGLPASRRRHW